MLDMKKLMLDVEEAKERTVKRLGKARVNEADDSPSELGIALMDLGIAIMAAADEGLVVVALPQEAIDKVLTMDEDADKALQGRSGAEAWARATGRAAVERDKLIDLVLQQVSPSPAADASPEDAGAGAEVASAERATERAKMKSLLSKVVMWDALAHVVGYNELVKDSQNLEEKMYLRLARAEAEKVYVSYGGQIVFSHDKPIIEVPTHPPFVALTDADIELMRKAIKDYDQKKLAETPIKWRVEHGFSVGTCGDEAVARVDFRELIWRIPQGQVCYLAEVTDLDGDVHNEAFYDLESAYKWCEEVRVAGSATKEEEKSP